MVLSFEANSLASLNCTFSDFNLLFSGQSPIKCQEQNIFTQDAIMAVILKSLESYKNVLLHCSKFKKKRNYLFPLCFLFSTTYFDQISPYLWPKYVRELEGLVKIIDGFWRMEDFLFGGKFKLGKTFELKTN